MNSPLNPISMNANNYGFPNNLNNLNASNNISYQNPQINSQNNLYSQNVN